MKVLWLCVVALVWGVSSPASAVALETETWGRVLARHVRDGRMDYAGLRNDPASRRDLMLFLRDAGRMNDDEPLASWLNLFNALVVDSVLERFPIGSVRDVRGFFDTQRHRVAGQLRTLDEIEQQVLLDRFKDSRVHAALCYGAVSSPLLLNEPFATATLDATLTRLAQELVASERNVRIEKDRLAVSSLFFWFDGFARDGKSVVGWIKKYGIGRFAAVRDGIALIEINYDWRLNAATPAPAGAPVPAIVPSAPDPLRTIH